MITKCFYDKSEYAEYKILKAYRSNLLQNPETIKITDFGSGSKVFTTDERSIKAIAKTSGTSLKISELLFRIVRYFQPNTILELGTNLGIGTHAMALANPKSQITTIEGCAEILKVAHQHLLEPELSNINTVQGDFRSVIENLNKDTWDLIFFDGHHSQDATLTYFEKLLPKAHNNSIFIFDDIYWSKGMTEAWENIKNHPQVTVTVDTFNWGLVFFRKEQFKEHFKIRV